MPCARDLRRTLPAVSAAALLAGCASWRQPAVEDVRPQRLARRAEVVREIDEQRDAAEFAAAREAWRQGDLVDCRRRLDRLLHRNADHREAALLRAEVALAERAPETALPLLERVAAGRPHDAETQRALAQLREALAESAATLVDYREAPTAIGEAAGSLSEGVADGDERECLTAARECLRRGEAGEAARIAERGLQRHTRSAALYRLVGLARYREGDYRAAEVALRQALSLDNSSALAYFLLGSALHRLGETEAAEEHFRRARSLDPRF